MAKVKMSKEDLKNVSGGVTDADKPQVIIVGRDKVDAAQRMGGAIWGKVLELREVVLGHKLLRRKNK